MLQYGTNVAAGVTPGKSGERVEGVTVYDKVAEAVEKTGARSSIIFVPAPYFYAAAEEAMKAGIKLVVAITEHVPIRDELKMIELARTMGATVIGPNTPGVIIPPRLVKMGIMPAPSFRPGTIALFSRSGTLMYEIANQLSTNGFGQAVALGIGGDPINGSTLTDCFDWVRNREDVNAVVAVGEIGGDAEERLAKYITETKFANQSSPTSPGGPPRRRRRWGTPGAIIYGNLGTAESKIAALQGAGVKIALTPAGIPELLASSLKK